MENIGQAYIVTGYDSSTAKPTANVCKGNDTEYARIGITDPDFTWVNLDYPFTWLNTSNVKTYCAEVDFVDNLTGSPFTQYIYFSYSGGSGYAYGGVGKVSVIESADSGTAKLSI